MRQYCRRNRLMKGRNMYNYMDKNAIKVSIVVPCYNVEQYIGECLDSLCRQTYQNIEIILIDDGSEDKTYEICAEWEKKDERIILYSKQNEGMGPTRNYGISIATGKYIFFVDSDDWIVEDAISHLVQVAERTGADVVTGDYQEYDEATKEIKEKHQQYLRDSEIVSTHDRGVYLLCGWVMVWGKLYNREFLQRKEIYMPSIVHEDNAIFPIVVMTANKIVCTSKLIYTYRINRNGSIINSGNGRLDISIACEYFLKYFSERNLLNQYYTILKRYTDTRVWFTINYFKENSQEDDLNILISKHKEIHDKYFVNGKMLWEYRFGLFGGFGNRFVLQQIGVSDRQLVLHYPFSSLIAQMSTADIRLYSVKNHNSFREDKIRDDFEGNLYKRLKNKDNLPDFFFIDFIEERFDVAELTDGNYITLSDAFDESSTTGIDIRRIIKAGTSEHMDLWKEKCKVFVKLLEESYSDNRIVLIKSRIALKYKIVECYKEYIHKERIIKFNVIIREMEQYFQSLFNKEIQVYELPEEIYSSEEFKFGAEPQYLATDIYKKMIMDIRISFDKQ